MRARVDPPAVRRLLVREDNVAGTGDDLGPGAEKRLAGVPFAAEEGGTGLHLGLDLQLNNYK